MRPETRLLDYIDEMAPPVSAQEAMTRSQTSSRSSVRGVAWAAVVFIVVLAVAGVYVALSGDDGEVVEPTPTTIGEPTPTTVQTTLPTPTQLAQEDYEPIQPGFYFVDADGDPSTSAGATVLVESQGWIGSKEGVNFNGLNGVSPDTLYLKLFVEPFTPVCGQGPIDPGVPLPAGSTAADLAAGIAASGFDVLEGPAPVTAFGRDGYHVVVQVPEGCQFGGERTPHVWIHPDDVMEVWSFDVDGSVVMIEALWLTASPGVVPEEDARLDVLRAVIDSLILTP